MFVIKKLIIFSGVLLKKEKTSKGENIMNKWLSNVALVLLGVALICVVGKNVKYSHIIQNGESTHIIHTGKGNVYTGLKIN